MKTKEGTSVQTGFTSKEIQKVKLELELCREDGPAFSATVSELYYVFGLLDRLHSVLSLLFHSDDPRVGDIRKTVQADGKLTQDMLNNIALLFPLDFVSLRSESPLKLGLLPFKEIGEAIDKVLMIPVNIWDKIVDIRWKMHEHKLKKRQEEASSLPVSEKELSVIRNSGFLKYTTDKISQVGFDKTREALQLIDWSLDIEMKQENLKQMKLETLVRSMYVHDLLLKTPVVRDAYSKMEPSESKAYSIEILNITASNNASSLYISSGSDSLRGRELTTEDSTQTDSDILISLAQAMRAMGEEEFIAAWREKFPDQEPPLEVLRQVVEKLE